MGKFLFTFLVLTNIIFLVIVAWRDMTNKERWSLAKSFLLALVIMIIASFIMGIFVALF